MTTQGGPPPPYTTYGGSGGVRESQAGRPRFDLLVTLDTPLEDQFLTRCARWMTKGLEKYPERNWELHEGTEALQRAESSAFRHFMAWMAGETDEDHAAAVVFNLQCAEHIKRKMEQEVQK